MSTRPGLELEGSLQIEAGNATFEVQAIGSVVEVRFPDIGSLYSTVRSLPPGLPSTTSQASDLLTQVGLTVLVQVAGRQVAQMGLGARGSSALPMLGGVQVDLWQSIQSILRPPPSS